jgi:hypothetical protein
VPPLAVQDVALVLVQEKVADCPGWICAEAAPAISSETVGGTGVAAVTVTLTELGAVVPPGPVQVRVYVTVPMDAYGPSVVPLPDVPVTPLHPSLPVPPLAVQEVALLLDQVSVED